MHILTSIRLLRGERWKRKSKNLTEMSYCINRKIFHGIICKIMAMILIKIGISFLWKKNDWLAKALGDIWRRKWAYQSGGGNKRAIRNYWLQVKKNNCMIYELWNERLCLVWERWYCHVSCSKLEQLFNDTINSTVFIAAELTTRASWESSFMWCMSRLTVCK